MLMLSRREAETVLFPKLGITIKVTRIQGRTVRLGIDAPEEIRIIRGELNETADWEIKQRDAEIPDCEDHSWEPPLEIAKCLDAANLAIHLAQNQLRQRRNDDAEEALDHAIECLKYLELAVNASRESSSETLAPTATPVRESKPRYQRRARKVALCVDFSSSLKSKMASQLDEHGYQSLEMNSGLSLLEFLRRRDRPDLVLTMRQPMGAGSKNAEPLFTAIPGGSRPGLRIFGVGSLQKCERTFRLGDSEVTGWFADSADAAAIENCF